MNESDEKFLEECEDAARHGCIDTMTIRLISMARSLEAANRVLDEAVQVAERWVLNDDPDWRPGQIIHAARKKAKGILEREKK